MPYTHYYEHGHDYYIKWSIDSNISSSIEKEAKKRMLSGKANPTEKVSEGGQARDKAADQFKTNRQYVSDVKTIEFLYGK